MMSRWAEFSEGTMDMSIVLLRDTSRPFTPLDQLLRGPNSARIIFDARRDNRRLVYERIAAAIPSSCAYLVANDGTELGMVAALGPPNPVAYALHGDYEFYYALAVRHSRDIGSFLCVSRRIQDKLGELLPQRVADIHLTHPIVANPSGRSFRVSNQEPLRLLFVGRLTEEKGFFDLRRIDMALRKAGTPAQWTIMAPRCGQLSGEAAEWLSAVHVIHRHVVPEREMEGIYLSHDILVFPSRAEGFSMAVLESMKCGMVPVVSRLDSGMPEMVDDGTTGFITDAGDHQAMALRIASLSRDRTRLRSMGETALSFSQERFDCSEAVNRLSQAVTAAAPRGDFQSEAPTYMSRLDRKWLPNSSVRFMRRMAGALRPKVIL
ncbi:MAG: glycosyltransferase family 4 protein [Gemmatimonadaceae bacterium]